MPVHLAEKDAQYGHELAFIRQKERKLSHVLQKARKNSAGNLVRLLLDRLNNKCYNVIKIVNNKASKERASMDAKELYGFLKEIGTSREYKAGELLFAQGDAANEFYYLKSGLTMTFSSNEEGRDHNILLTRPGKLFGATTFFEGVPRRASAIALEQSEVVIINALVYQQCQEEFPDFLHYMLRELSEDVGVLFEQAADNALMDADTRVARFLCRSVIKGECRRTGAEMELEYTQDFIANMLGLSRWAVNRALARFRENGWVDTDYRAIRVKNYQTIYQFGYGA